MLTLAKKKYLVLGRFGQCCCLLQQKIKMQMFNGVLLDYVTRCVIKLNHT